MRLGMITNLKPSHMQGLDLLPSQVVLLILQELKAFGDIESRPETILLQERCHEGRMTGHGIIKGQDH